MNAIYYFSQGLMASPYIIVKFGSSYITPWIYPTITWDKSTPEMIELDDQKNIVRKPIPESIIPHIGIHKPTIEEVSIKAASILIIDVPLYTLRQLHASPIMTVIALWAILPPQVWTAILPRLFHLLPSLLV